MSYLDDEIDDTQAAADEQDAQDLQDQEEAQGFTSGVNVAPIQPKVQPVVTSTTSKTYQPRNVVDPGNPMLNAQLAGQTIPTHTADEPYAPILEYLDKIKPQPNVEDEERQKKLAKFNALGQALNLVANGVGAANGATVIPQDNKIGSEAYNRYLADRQKYKAETDAWQNQYLKTVAQSTQHKIAQQAKDEAEQRKNNEWYNQKKIEYEEKGRELGLKNDAELNKLHEQFAHADTIQARELAAKKIEGKLNREARASNKKPYASPFEIRMSDDTKIGLSKTDAAQLYTEAVQDPAIQAKYPALIATSFDAPGAQHDKTMGLLNTPEVIAKYGSKMAEHDEYKQTHKFDEPPTTGTTDLQLPKRTIKVPQVDQQSLMEDFADINNSKASDKAKVGKKLRLLDTKYSKLGLSHDEIVYLANF